MKLEVTKVGFDVLVCDRLVPGGSKELPAGAGLALCKSEGTAFMRAL